MDLVNDSSATGRMTRCCPVAMHRAARFLTGFCAGITGEAMGSKERNVEDRVESKIKGDGTADATNRCLHVNGGGTPRRWAVGETVPDCTRCLLPARAVCAGLRWATKTHGHGRALPRF